jgi:hypothetical protein
MAQTRTYKKRIACLETLWDTNIQDRLDVVPILELASKVNAVDFTHLTCHTKEELRFNLRMLKRKSGYGILYVAFHGGPGEIYLYDNSTISLEQFAEYMGRGFNGWIVHFSTCGTIGVEQQRLAKFIAATNVSMIVGYKRDVDWMEGAALDLLLFSWLQSYKNMRTFWTRFKKQYSGLISATGLQAFHPIA